MTESAVDPGFKDVVFRPVGVGTESIPASAIWLKGNVNPALKLLLRMARVLAAEGAPATAEA